MQDVLADIDRWLGDHEKVALATVVQTWGSSPRGVGSRMGITASGKICGSVSGGCVEGAVVEAANEVLKTGRAQLLHFGVADETAWEVGLACGGSIDVFVNRVDTALFKQVHSALDQSMPIAVVTAIGGPEQLVGHEMVVQQDGNVSGGMDNEFTSPAEETARRQLDSGRPGRARVSGPSDTVLEVFIDVLLPPPTLVIIGGAHVSIALVTLAKTLGFRTIVIDPRKAFGTAERFSHADQLIQVWPDKALKEVGLTRSTAVAVLTHDPKIDDPALIAALPSPAFYVGALGSSTTQAKRRQRLLEAGISPSDIERLHGPIGLDIGAKRPEEIALAVMAEIIAEREKVPTAAQ